MKYAICNEMYGNAPISGAFKHAAKFGYTGIEIAPFTLGENAMSITDATKNEVRVEAEKNGLEIVGLHWLLAKTQGLHLTSPDKATRDATSEYISELARLCQELGGKIMVFGSPQQRNVPEGMSMSQAIDHAVEVFKNVTPVLESTEVTLALEPLGPEEGNFMLTAQSAIEIAQAVDSEFVKLHLDVKAMTTEAKPISQIIRDCADWMVHFHANDANRLGPGMGEVDYEPIFQALKDVEYDNWISVEVFDYSPGVDRLASESIEYMKRISGVSR